MKESLLPHTNIREAVVQKTLDGLGIDVQLNGNRPWDMQIHNPNVFYRGLLRGSKGVGKAYVQGIWDCDDLEGFFERVLGVDPNKPVLQLYNNVNIPRKVRSLKGRLVNAQKGNKSRELVEMHYDARDEAIWKMLGAKKAYSCGYWEGISYDENSPEEHLNEAQTAKLDLVCRKLRLEKGMKILDIGCGYGAFAKHAAEKYGVQVVGITLSKNQILRARELCCGLPVEIRDQDYHDIPKGEIFDGISSIGMKEHVGHKNYESYAKEGVWDHLSDTGFFVDHFIGSNRSKTYMDPFFEEEIFADSQLPSLAQSAKSYEGLFVVEDVQNISYDYKPTLIAWFNNFHREWVNAGKDINDPEYRLMKYYLLGSAGNFGVRSAQVYQITATKRGVRGHYQSVR